MPRSKASLKQRTIPANSDTATRSVPIIAARKRVGKSKRDAVAAPVVQPPDDWDTLAELIGDYREAAIAESWKGGGDPEEIPVFEAQLVLAGAKLGAHIARMKRDRSE